MNVFRLAITIMFTLLVTGVIAQETDPIKFSFSPGEKVSFVQKLTMSKEKDLGNGNKQLDESLSTTKFTISRTGAGWEVLVQPQSITMKRDGKSVENPIVKLLSSAVITYSLGPDGNILDVAGYDAFINSIATVVPPEVFSQLSPVLNVDAMKAKEIAEWNGRYGDYLGVEVNVGDTFSATVPFQLPNGAAIEYDVETSIAALEPCGASTCVRIQQVYDSDARNAAKMSADMVNDLAQKAAPNAPTVTSDDNSASISGNISRLIDPNTMLIYGEQLTRTITMAIAIDGAGSNRAVMTENRNYEYQY